jgi:glycosyltransferase involved in cell wall biosynthesis
VEGIGVFVHNVTRGLLDLPDGIEVVLVVGPGDATLPAVAEFQKVGGRRFRVLSFTSPNERLRAIARNWLRWAAERRHRRTRGRGEQSALPGRSRLSALVRRAVRTVPRNRVTLAYARKLRSLAEWTLLPLLMAAGVARLMVRTAVKQTIRVATSPLKTAILQLKAWAERPSTADPADVIRAADVDAWLVPYVLIGYPLDEPSVLVIHDLVTHHFPDGFAKATLEAVAKLAPENASRATLCACMSEFIHESDLKGVLKLPDEKVAVVRPAAPTDFPETTPEVEASIRERLGDRPFLLYPAAFRPYKNHETLIEGLGELHRRGYRNFDVVFTGSGQVTAACREALERHGLHDRVHVLRFVSREELAALYRQAFATVVPSLYEQGSFPVYEALHFGCPVACSDIAPLKEQSASMGDAMLYFEPKNPASLADAVERIIRDREGIRRRQAAAKSTLWERRWVDAAAEWVVVLEEAAARGGRRDAAKLLPAERAPERAWIESVCRSPAFAEPQEPVEVDGEALKPVWPRRVSRAVRMALPEAFIFLPNAGEGGARTRQLIETLADINRDRRELLLSVGIDVRDSGFDLSQRRNDPLTSFHRIRLSPIGRHAAAQVLGRRPDWLVERSDGGFLFFDIGGDVALRADAWLSLSERLPLPILPARPYGVLVQGEYGDLAASAHCDQTADGGFLEFGVRPTLESADWLVTSTPWNAEGLTQAFGFRDDRLRSVPDYCEPSARFANIATKHVPFITPGCTLVVAGDDDHNGIEAVIAAQAILKARLGAATPPLIVCGPSTDRLSPILADGHGNGGVSDQVRAFHAARDASTAEDRLQWRAVRRLIRQTDLCEGVDLVFLGAVTDRHLKDLYEKAAIIVDGSGRPNGSRSLVDATWFAKPTASSRTAAAEWFAERFHIPTRFFPYGDGPALADLLTEVIADRDVVAAELDAARTGLAWAEFSGRRFAERIYGHLVELAERNRRTTTTLTAPRRDRRRFLALPKRRAA